MYAVNVLYFNFANFLFSAILHATKHDPVLINLLSKVLKILLIITS